MRSKSRIEKLESELGIGKSKFHALVCPEGDDEGKAIFEYCERELKNIGPNDTVILIRH